MGLPLRVFAALLVATVCHGQSKLFERVSLPVTNEAFRGGALEGSALYTWGDRLLSWRLPTGNSTVVTGGPFGTGGCATGDRLILSGPEGGMISVDAASGESRVMDAEARVTDCVPATLHGRSGVVALHEYHEIRFYEPSARHVLASVETPPRQGGLLVADIDEDGRDDILFGNYWLRAPAQLDQPWPVARFNLWNEMPASGVLRLVWLAGSVVASQREMPEARLAWFRRPAEPAALWPGRRLEGRLRLRNPTALATGDIDEDGRVDVIAGENGGPGSRLLLFYNQGEGRFLAAAVDTTSGLLQVWAEDIDGDTDLDLVGVSPAAVTWWRNQRLK